MALSYFGESEAPRDFRVSSTDSDGHYKKCLLCFTVKRNFYCPDCIRAGNFVSSSMPYSDKFAEKQAKLLRLKANRQHVLDRCERLLTPKLKRDTLITEAKQTRDQIDLLRLAIEQRRSNIEDKKKELTEFVQYNNELRLKLPRYQKRVASLARHAQQQAQQLRARAAHGAAQAHALAALRRARIRQLNRYIFPVYMTYDSSDSIEDLEFVGSDAEEEAPTAARARLHVAAPWICARGLVASERAADTHSKSPEGGGSPAAPGGAVRSAAALGLAAQLLALLAATLDARLPRPVALSEYCNWRVSAAGLQWRVRRVCGAAGALCRGAALPPPPRAAPLQALHALCAAAAADAPQLGRVSPCVSSSAAAAWETWAAHAAGGEGGADDADDADDDTEPEHLHWPDAEEMEEAGATPAPAPAPAPSLVTSAAASLASMWRGWTK